MNDIVSASDSVLQSGKIIIDSPNAVQNVDPFLNNQSQARTGQQSILPATVGARLLGSIISSSASGIGNGSFLQYAVPPGSSVSFIFTVSDKKGRTIIAVPDTAVYIGYISQDTHWPNATYGMATLPVVVNNDWGLTDNVDVVTRIIVRNNFTDPVPIIAVCRWRIITNPTQQLAQSDTEAGDLLTGAQGVYGGSGGGRGI